jgi:subtilisin-like proprotein convertase family protein
LLLISTNVFAQCNWYTANTACTSNAPTALGQSITCTPPDNNAGRRNFVVNNMISNNVYRISNCGSGYDTQLTIRNAVGDVVGYNDDNGPDCTVFAGSASLDFVCPSNGQYWIQLNRYNCQTGSTIDNGAITVTLISNATTTCSTTAITLTASSTTPVNWYSGSCSGSLIGTGTTISVSPNTTTTYYASSSSWPTCMNTIVNVTPSLANVNAGNDVSICSGASTPLAGSTATTALCSSTSTLTNSTNYAVPDDNAIGGSSIINVSSSCGTAAEIVSVKVNINHLWVQDLDISLIAPNGSTINLSSDNGGSGSNYINTVFTASGLMSITSGIAPFTGIYIPEEPFSNLTGSAVGNWTLKVVDDEIIIGGTIVNWSIVVKTNQNALVTYSWSPTTGLSNSNISNPIASPTTTTTYTMTATVNGCSASDSVIVSLYPVLIAGVHNSSPLTQCAGYNPAVLTFTTNPTGGNGNYTYQWQLNTVDILNATSNSYDPNPILIAGVYSYRCKITDGCGSTVFTIPKEITIVADPNQPSCLKFPNLPSVCVGTSLTLQNCMFGSQTGLSCPFEYSYSIDGGVSWSSTSTTIPNFSANGTTNLIRARVSNCGSCNASSWMVYSWNIYPTPSTTNINHN